MQEEFEHIAREDFQYWHKDKVTKEIFKARTEVREDKERRLLDLVYDLESPNEAKRGEMVGYLQALDLLLEITAEDVVKEKK